MLYYSDNDRKGKIIGGVATLVYMVVLVVLMLVVSFDMERVDYGEGILVDFGDTEMASGMTDPDINQTTQPSDPQTVSDNSPDEILTQDNEDAPSLPEQPQRPRPEQTPRPTTTPQSTQQQTQPTTQEPPRQVNQNALFPGRTPGSTSASQGSSESGKGNQGSQDGSPGGSPDGTGGGGSGHGFSLAGRSIIGSLPTPTYGANKQGRVVVEIVVDASGRVINASYRAQGSTTNDGELVKAATDAARRSRFNTIESDGNQTGTITYNFKLK